MMTTARSGSGDPGIGTLLSLNEAVDPAIAGRKAASLALLRARGFHVPDGWVIPADVAESVAAGESVPFIGDQLGALPNTPMAVRSSGIAEDGDEVSLAGQYESLLNVSGADAILEAIRAVWLSGQRLAQRTPHSNGVDQLDAGVVPTAILIQPMLQPDAAGVAFSANPVTGDREEIVINAVSGLGDRLMAGELDPETWTVRAGAVQHPDGGGNVLDDRQVRRVAQLAEDVETTFGKPQDIEWALVGDDLYLLQARPITALPVRPEFPPLPPGSWMKETEHFTTQVSVLQSSLYVTNFPVVTKEMCATHGMLLDRLQLIDRGGELYIQPVPLGERHGPPPPGPVLGLLARVIPTLRARIKQAKKVVEAGELEKSLDRWESEWRGELRARGQKLVNVDRAALTHQELAEHLTASRELFLQGMRYHFHLTAPTIYFPYLLVEVCREFFSWSEQDALMLIAETAEASSAPGRALHQLVEAALGRPLVTEILSRPDVRIDEISEADPEFGALVRRYLDEFGHRVLDNEISVPTLYERPDLVLHLIRERVVKSGDEGGVTASNQITQREKASELIRMRSPEEQQRFTQALELATRANRVREDKIVYTLYLPGAIIRYGVLEAGRRLAQRGVIGRNDDVFYLTFDEVYEAVGATGPASLRRTVATRRSERAWVAANPGPPVLGDPPAQPDPSWLPEPARTATKAFAWHLGELGSSAEPGGSQIRGTGVSAGRYRGPVRIIRDQTDFHRLTPGDVLVCPVTTSAWGILFSTAGALITDHGGILSHPAIAAREHGLPAVVGTQGATSVLREGQMVVVDGSTGEVELLEAR